MIVFITVSHGLHLLILICIFIFNVVIINCFNLETRLPVVKQGHNGSYFGYAVAAHQIRNGNEQTNSINEGLILVGAPLGQNLQPDTTRSGALWKCPLTNYKHDCIQVITDGRKDPETEIYKNDLEVEKLFPPSIDEIKEDQWLGVTVKSQGPGGKVMVCAHRYKTNTTAGIAGLGLCYILRQDLEFENAYIQCKGRLRGGGHMDFGVCQSGTSGLIFDDENAIVGAPGTMTWRGAIFVFSVADDYLKRDKIVYLGNGTDLGEDTNANERIKKDGYMGMSLAAGHFNGNNNTVEYAAGAPRANETGQVVLFTKPSTMNGKSVDWHLQEYLIIGGEQIASNFGYEIIGADVNGDKLPDLIVAAPFYFNLAKGEGGAVYIYLNDPIKHLRGTVPTRITGKFESRFGFAMTCLGDLNNDGFDDIAVGAPYEGSGVVYVYLGSKDGLITEPSQIIKAETVAINSPISTFGYSLSGGIDLDENGYPDLVVGAYEKDTVVLLRARPIIGFTTYVKSPSNLTNFDPHTRNCMVNNKIYNIPCFQFETCCVIDSIVKPYVNHQLLVMYTLEAETFNNQRTSSRIWFDEFQSRNQKIVKNLTIFNNNGESCQTHIAFLKENTQDIQSPIQMKMSYHLVHQEPQQTLDGKLLSLDNYPILNQREADKVFNATFLKNCGSDYICESRLVVNSNFSLRHLREFFDEIPNQYELVLGEQQKAFLNVTVANLGESAYEAKLFIELPKNVEYGGQLTTESNEKKHVCGRQKGFIVCELGNPLKQNREVNLQLKLDLGEVDESEPSLHFKIFANTTSVDENRDLEPLTLKVKVIEKMMLSIFGESTPEEIPKFVNIQLKGESAIKYKEEIGNKVTHSYTVFNNGSWRVSGIRVEIEWPFQVANNKPQGKWLLYMDDVPVVEGAGKCDVSADFINPLKLSDRKTDDMHSDHDMNSFSSGDKFLLREKLNLNSKGQHNRVKRDTEMIVTPEIYTNKDGNKYRVVKMNCLLNTAKCYKFSCYLDSIGSKEFVKIVVRSRLWDATLIEDYSNVDEIKIASRAKMHIPDSSVTLENIYSNEFQIETIARVTLHGQQSAAPVPIFIIIAAIIIGLLLFILLTLLLWKLGFFKRRRPDPTLSGNLEKHRIDEYHDY